MFSRNIGLFPAISTAELIIPCVQEIGNLETNCICGHISSEACVYRHIPRAAEPVGLGGFSPPQILTFARRRFTQIIGCFTGSNASPPPPTDRISVPPPLHIPSKGCIYGYISSEACVYHLKTENLTVSQCRSFSCLISIRHLLKFRSPRFESCPVFCFLPQ